MRTGRFDVRYLPRGFTYIGLLLFIAISGIGLAAVGQVWKTEAQREREKELLFVGEQYARAIASYYEASPGGAKQYPRNLEDLLLDDRFPVVKRHLRKLFRDPVTGSDEWGVVREQGGISGVYSLSEMRPLRASGWPPFVALSGDASRYLDLHFVSYASASPDVAVPVADASGGGGPLVIAAPASAEQPTVNGPQPGSKPASGNPKPAAGNEDDFARKQQCHSQQVSDTAACSFLCREKGPTSNDCRQCQISILSRRSACLKGGDIPDLATGS